MRRKICGDSVKKKDFIRYDKEISNREKLKDRLICMDPVPGKGENRGRMDTYKKTYGYIGKRIEIGYKI